MRRTISMMTFGMIATFAVAAEASHWDQALTHLSRAEQALEQAQADKGGHRKQALEQIYKAENEVQHGAQSARDSHDSSGGGKVDLKDLVGARGSSFDSEMGRRGFKSTGGFKEDGASHTTWHNAKTHQCVAVVTREGRIDSIKDIVEGNCL